MKVGLGDRIFTIVVYALLGIIFVVVFFPLMYVVSTSFASAKELAENRFLIFPKNPTLEVYQYIFSTNTFSRSMLVSVFVTIVGTIVNLFMTCLMAYPISRTHLRGRRIIMSAITFTLLFNGGMIPTYLVVSNLHMLDSYTSLIIPGAISSFNLILVKNFFQQIPESLIDAAQIDGCTEMGTFVRIVLPLSKPALATFTMFYAVGHWNQFLQPLLYLNDSKKWPIQILLRQIVLMSQSGVGDEDAMPPQFVLPVKSLKMACIVVSTLPIIAAYPFMQKYFDKGVMTGAIKG